MTLFDLDQGEKGYILKIKGRGKFRQRIMEMGFIAGKEVTFVKKALLKDPVEYIVMDYHVTLSNSEAMLIKVAREEDNVVSNYLGFKLFSPQYEQCKRLPERNHQCGIFI
jgi:Fe2+ transport system protein FeoA